MKKLIPALVGVLMLGLTAVATPAHATTPDTRTKKTCPTWSLRSIVTGWQAPAEGSKVRGPDKVVLTKPANGGTEFATFDAGLEFDSPVTVSVFYKLSDDADFAAGAIRLFFYEASNANTLTDTPTASKAAMSKLGVLTISGVTKIGTLGLVYDASNTAGGSVTFSHLKAGHTSVLFKNVCAPHSPSPSPTPTVTASTSPSPSSSPSPSASSTSPAPGVSVSTSPAAGPSLPQTGSPIWLVTAVGGLLVVAGLGGLLLARRRRQRFES